MVSFCFLPCIWEGGTFEKRILLPLWLQHRIGPQRVGNGGLLGKSISSINSTLRLGQIRHCTPLPIVLRCPGTLSMFTVSKLIIQICNHIYQVRGDNRSQKTGSISLLWSQVTRGNISWNFQAFLDRSRCNQKFAPPYITYYEPLPSVSVSKKKPPKQPLRSIQEFGKNLAKRHSCHSSRRGGRCTTCTRRSSRCWGPCQWGSRRQTPKFTRNLEQEKQPKSWYRHSISQFDSSAFSGSNSIKSPVSKDAEWSKLTKSISTLSLIELIQGTSRRSQEAVDCTSWIFSIGSRRRYHADRSLFV